MASSSSSTAMASSSSDEASSYDVFLSFRGEDTRHSFTDHLYHKLIQAGISTFRDNEEIKRGEQLKPEIERAIKASRASIVVLSENYATSAWCLDELLLILQQRRECNHFVLPVFYHVKPADIKNQRGSFAVRVKPSSKWTDHNVNLWTTALMQVANLSGTVVSGPETSILKKIIDTVYNKLGPKDVHLPLNITGLVTRYEEISSWLDQCNLEILAIYGMGGSGKTTLAKYIYNSNWKRFEYVSFVEHIGIRCQKTNGLLEVQEQLLKDILGGKERKIPGVFRGTPMIEEALQMKRVLIVLDDIVGYSQLVDLLGTGEINSQSKIIITTRENTDNWLEFPYRRCKKYEMRLLNTNESSELLCHHAFRSEIPKVGFQEVVLRAVQYCAGNPLALEVLGSSLFNNDTVQYWESQLSLFGRDIDSRIQDVLVKSYESLPCETVKGLFLHIACFFNGVDMDYVVKILERDYAAISGIKTLINRCLLSISLNKKLTMHRLIQNMGKNIVSQESVLPAKRSRVWLSSDSYKILRKGMGSEKVEGLALDMKRLAEENFAFKPAELKTDALNNMDRLKLLQLNFVELSGSYENFSEDLKWLCWLGFQLRSIPCNLYMGNLVAIDMSHSKLEVFEPPMDIQSLKILNLKDSHQLVEIRNIFMIPNLETLILWNCYSLASVCKTIGALKRLATLNMTGCKNLFNREQTNSLSTSTSGGVATKFHTFFFPFSLHRLFLKDCHLECTESFPLSFTFQPDLQYLNLSNSIFDSLPCYNHLENLRVLDLSFCSSLECLICLPSTLAELYVYGCELLEKITFQSPRFTLQEFGYLGCIHLYEVEGFIKLVPIVKLDETDLGHMKWLKKYQNHQVCLVGDDELTEGRSWHIQMMYEFGIMSTSLPDTNDPNVTPKYISESSSLSFDVPSCPENKRLKGINVILKYAILGDDCAWFCKISTTNGVVDLMYNPRVFGKPESGEVCVWLSYWPIGNTLDTGDTVNVSIIVMNGLKILECGASIVYSDHETLENNMEWEEILGGDMSGFQLSTGAYYLCRRDFFELMEVGRLTSDWFRILVGDTIDYTEVRGWRKTGRSKQVNPSFTELKTIRCIIYGPQLEDIYKFAEMPKSYFGDKTVAFNSNSSTTSELINEAMEEIYVKPYKDADEIDGDSISTFEKVTREKSEPYSHERITNSATREGKSPSSSASTPPSISAHPSTSARPSISAYPSTSAHPCRSYNLAEIQSATKNFSDELVIGKGGFGTVYKGQISSEEAGHVVAIKRLDPDGRRIHEFRAEIDTLCEFHHRHLVSLIGYCDEGKENILVYEYMPNGTLDHHLHDAHSPLSWVTRLKIAIGTARGLDYLHTGGSTSHGVIHRNVSSSNILLDENWAAVISGFGLSRTGPTSPSISYVKDIDPKGTLGYFDPDYYHTGNLTWKTDVYSFGVVLFELLSGRRAVDFHNEEGQFSLVEWAKKCIIENKLDQMVDSDIKGTISTNCLRGFTQIASRCVHNVPDERPSMSELVASLQALLELQEKSNLSTGFMGFTRKILKYFVPATKQNSD